jgi:hypothetical protein
MRPGLCFDDAAFSFPLFSGAGVCVIVCSRLHARAAYQVPLAERAQSNHLLSPKTSGAVADDNIARFFSASFPSALTNPLLIND